MSEIREYFRGFLDWLAGQDRFGWLKIALLTALFAGTTYYVLPDKIDVGGGWWNCLDYVGEGSLYSGQPYCAQGPVIYYLGFLYQSLLGEGGMLYFFWILIILSHTFTFILLSVMLRRESLLEPSSLALIYLLGPYRFIGKIAPPISVAFMMLGTYILLYRRGEYRGIAAGFFFSASIFTKYITLFPILAVLAYFVYREAGRGGRADSHWYSHFPKDSEHALILCIESMAVVFLLLVVFLPGLIEYSFMSQMDITRFHFLDVDRIMFEQRNVNDLVFVVLLIVGVQSVRKGWFGGGRMLYPFAASTLAFHSFIFLRTKGTTIIGSSYNLAGYVFLAGFMMAVREKSFKAFTLLVLLVLVYPGVFPMDGFNPLLKLSRSSYYDYRDQASRMVETSFRHLSLVEGKVLYEGLGPQDLDFFERYDTGIGPERVDVLYHGMKGLTLDEDGDWGPKIRSRMHSMYPKWHESNLTSLEKTLQERILSGYYDLVYLGAPAWTQIGKIVDPVLPKLREKHCIVSAPNFYYMGGGRDYAYMIFKNWSVCRSYYERMVEDYERDYEKICSFSPMGARVVEIALDMNNYTISKKCVLEDDFDFSGRKRAGWRDLVIAIVLYPILFIFLKWFADSPG